MKKVYLSKKWAWIVFIILLSADAILDVVRGAEGNPLWKNLVENVIGIEWTPILVLPILLLFYLVIKAVTLFLQKVNPIPHAEEILLTTLVIAYFVYDLWVIAVDFLGFRLIKNHYQMIPILLVVCLGYALWVEYKVKKQEKISQQKEGKNV